MTFRVKASIMICLSAREHHTGEGNRMDTRRRAVGIAACEIDKTCAPCLHGSWSVEGWASIGATGPTDKANDHSAVRSPQPRRRRR